MSKYCEFLTEDNKCSCKTPLECSFGKLINCPATHWEIEENVKKLSDPIIIDSEPDKYYPKSGKHLRKFNKWVKKHKLRPGMVIPKRIFKKHFREKKIE